LFLDKAITVSTLNLRNDLEYRESITGGRFGQKHENSDR